MMTVWRGLWRQGVDSYEIQVSTEKDSRWMIFGHDDLWRAASFSLRGRPRGLNP